MDHYLPQAWQERRKPGKTGYSLKDGRKIRGWGTRKKEIRREQINETVQQLDIPRAIFRISDPYIQFQKCFSTLS